MASFAWLQRHRKGDLMEMAEMLGLKEFQNMRKADLEISLDELLFDNEDKYASDPLVAGYYAAVGRNQTPSLIKREPGRPYPESNSRWPKRRFTRASEDLYRASEDLSRSEDFSRDEDLSRDEDAREDELQRSSLVMAQFPHANAMALMSPPPDMERSPTPTPAGYISLASNIALPPTPADLAKAVDRGSAIVRREVATLYQKSGVVEATRTLRESLSTVTSVLFCIAAFELWYLRPALLVDRYAFTVPALPLVGLARPHPVYVPDMFRILTASFWSASLVWTLTSAVIPCAVGYFFNLTTSATSVRGTLAQYRSDYVVDPLTFSIVKAVLSYLVYAEGTTFGGLLDPSAIVRLESAVYGGWRGILIGCAITALLSVYDAILRK